MTIIVESVRPGLTSIITALEVEMMYMMLSPPTTTRPFAETA
jgi:hypothetical protein